MLKTIKQAMAAVSAWNENSDIRKLLSILKERPSGGSVTVKVSYQSQSVRMIYESSAVVSSDDFIRFLEGQVKSEAQVLREAGE